MYEYNVIYENVYIHEYLCENICVTSVVYNIGVLRTFSFSGIF